MNRHTSQRQMRADPLPQRTTLAAFPRLEMAAADERQRVSVAPHLVMERAKLDAEIVALADQVEVLFQLAQAFLRLLAEPFPKLITLVEQACVGGIGTERALVGGTGFRRLMADAESLLMERLRSQGGAQ